MIFAILLLIAPCAILVLSFCFGLYVPMKSWTKIWIVSSVSFLGMVSLCIAADLGSETGLIRWLIYLVIFLVTCLAPTISTICGATNREKLQEKRLASFRPESGEDLENYKPPQNPEASTIPPTVRSLAWLGMYLILAAAAAGFVWFGACFFTINI